MRLILAKIVFNFDIELDSSSKDWIVDQKLYAFWIKPELNIIFKPRRE